MPSCVMRYCKNTSKNSSKASGITFHKFAHPSHEYREKWIKFVQNNRSEESWLPSDHSCICSLHFREEDKYTTKNGRLFLKKSAVPCDDDVPAPSKAVSPAGAAARAGAAGELSEFLTFQDDTELNSDDDVSDAEPSLYDSSKDKKSKKSSAAASAAAQGDEHEGFRCNTCQEGIFGFRYTCVECVEFDMCAACERRGAHAYHYVLRVPGPRPRMEVRALVKRIRREVLKVVEAGDDSSGDVSNDSSDDGSNDASDDEPDEIPKSEVKLEPAAGPDPLQPHSEIVTAFDTLEVSEIKLEFESGDETEEPTESEAGAVTSTVSRQPVAATPSAAQLRTLPQAKLWPVLEISQDLRVGQPDAGPLVEIKVEMPAAEAAGISATSFKVFTHAKDSQKVVTGAGRGAGAKRKPAARPAAATQRSAAKRKK